MSRPDKSIGRPDADYPEFFVAGDIKQTRWGEGVVLLNVFETPREGGRGAAMAAARY